MSRHWDGVGVPTGKVQAGLGGQVLARHPVVEMPNWVEPFAESINELIRNLVYTHVS